MRKFMVIINKQPRPTNSPEIPLWGWDKTNGYMVTSCYKILTLEASKTKLHKTYDE